MSKCRLFLYILLLAGAARCALALELGDSRDEIETRYGTAPLGDHPKEIAIYWWDAWKLEIHYTKGQALTLIYTKIDPIPDDEVATILNQNGGAAHWRPAASSQGRTTAWMRTDGATAGFDGSSGKTMTLHGGHLPVVAEAIAPSVVLAPQPKVIAPALKNPAVSPPVQNPSAKMNGKPVAKPDAPARNFLWSILSAALHEKMVYVGLALIVGGLLLRKLKNPAPEPQATGRRPGPPPFPKAASVPRLPALELVPTLENLGWQRFELLMGEVFRRQGYEVEIAAADGPDGGADLRLRKNGALVLAQCKCYLSGKVSVQPVREFFGVIAHEHAARGIFVNTSAYTQDALKFAEGKDLELLDADGVKALINSVTQSGENIYDVQRWLPEFLAHAEVKHPDCPFCASPMVQRSSPKGGNFWGCSGYPACNGTREVRSDLMKRVA